MAKAVDSWRIFPRISLTTYIILLYKCVIWYMELPDQYGAIGLISIVVGAGAAWFGPVYWQLKITKFTQYCIFYI